MNDSNYISIQEPIANAKMQLGISHSTEDPYLQTKAFEAETQIGSAYTIVRRQEEVDIVDYQAEMPKGFHSLIALRFPGDSTCECPAYIAKSFYKSDPDCPNTFESQFEPNFTLNDGVIYFSTDITATQCEIAYNGFNLDEDGWLRIHESHEVAIYNYICWQYCLKYYEQFPLNVRKDYEAQWKKKCMQARGKSKMPDPAERQYLQLLWNNQLRPFNHIF